MATELGTPSIHSALWGQGFISLGHPSHSVSPGNRQLGSSSSRRPCAMGLLSIPTEASARRKGGIGEERREEEEKRIV